MASKRTSKKTSTFRPGAVSDQQMKEFRRVAARATEQSKRDKKQRERTRKKRITAAKKIQNAIRSSTKKRKKKRNTAAIKLQSHFRKQSGITKKYNKTLKVKVDTFIEEVRNLPSVQQLYESIHNDKKKKFEKCLRNCYRKHSNMQKLYKIPGSRFSIPMGRMLKQFSNDSVQNLRRASSNASFSDYRSPLSDSSYDGINSAAAIEARKKKPSPIDLSPAMDHKKSRFIPITPGKEDIISQENSQSSYFDNSISDDDDGGAGGESKKQIKQKNKTSQKSKNIRRGRFEILDEEPEIIEDSGTEKDNSLDELSDFDGSKGGKRRKSKKLRIRISKKNKKSRRRRKRKNKKLFGLF
tara:strand:- start:1939 stop:3000 length:1062 start_codon:yes stop_codon:yes gene_type:complete